MTYLEAIEELARCADLCPTTPLAKACRIAIEALGPEDNGDHKTEHHKKTPDLVGPHGEYKEQHGGPPHDCPTCRHRDRMLHIYPCNTCSRDHDKWEPKGE